MHLEILAFVSELCLELDRGLQPPSDGASYPGLTERLLRKVASADPRPDDELRPAASISGRTAQNLTRLPLSSCCRGENRSNSHPVLALITSFLDAI